jgi:hypothetical protein
VKSDDRDERGHAYGLHHDHPGLSDQNPLIPPKHVGGKYLLRRVVARSTSKTLFKDLQLVENIFDHLGPVFLY